MKIVISIIVASCLCFLAWAALPTSRRSLTVTDFSVPTEVSVRAPIRPFGSGAMYVLYEGTIGSDAKIEVTSNKGRDTHTIQLNAGQTHGVYGGAEEWVDDLSVAFIPSSPASGILKIGIYCGSRFSDDDRKWYGELSRK